MTTSTERIQEARERFNAAIEQKDANTIQDLLLPTYHIVTGRSDQNHGADNEANRWAEQFSTDPTEIYRRTPRQITINEAWGIAEELGNWQGSYTIANTLIQASGVYSAKWHRKQNEEWALQAEVFTTITCEGPCHPPDPT